MNVWGTRSWQKGDIFPLSPRPRAPTRRQATAPAAHHHTSPQETPPPAGQETHAAQLPFAVPRQRLQGEHDALAPSPPNPEILGFHPGTEEGGKGMYLSVASKEEDGVRNVSDTVAATACQRSLPARAPNPATPTHQPNENAKLPLGWVPRGHRSPS